MDAQAIGYQSGYQEPGRLQSTPQKSNKLFAFPLIHGEESPIKPEVMVWVWQQIVNEGKNKYLFYDDNVMDLREWLEYIYNPNNFVVLVIDNEGHIYHIAWINKFYRGHGFLHHCSLGLFNRRSWPILKKYWQDMRTDEGLPVIRTLLGITPQSNTKAVRLVKMLGWTILGAIPGICYLANENRHDSGIVSYCVINEV